MKKRIVSLLLLACMLLTLLPGLLPVAVAAEAVGTPATGAEKVTVTFRLADDRDAYGYGGTIVAERSYEAGTVYFDLPTEAECYVKGLDPRDVLGWYHILPDGEIIDAAAYNGAYLVEDMTFYPILRSSTFSPLGEQNIPVLATEASGTQRAVIAMRGGWMPGAYVAQSSGAPLFVPYDSAGKSSNLAIRTGYSAWTYGGIYYKAGGGGDAYVLSGNASSVSAVTYRAVAAGDITLTFDSIRFLNGAGGTTVAQAVTYLAVAVDGKIVWPTAEAGDDIVTTGFAAAGWHTVSLGNATAESANTDVAIPGGSLQLTVQGGEQISFLLGYGNLKTFNFAPTVTYNTVGAMWEGIERENIVITSTASADHTPTFADMTTPGAPTFHGGWDYVFYSGNRETGTAQTCVGSGIDSDIYLVPSGSAFNLGNVYLDGYTGNYAGTYWQNYGHTVAFSIGGSREIGLRYTAEYAGLIDLRLTDFFQNEKNASDTVNARLAIWVDGVKVFPRGIDTYYALSAMNVDEADAVNAVLPTGIAVAKGSQVEFLISRTDPTASDTCYSCRCVTLNAAIDYVAIYEEASSLKSPGHLPMVDKTGAAASTYARDAVTYPGNWQAIAYTGGKKPTDPTGAEVQTSIYGAAPAYVCGQSATPVRFMYNENHQWGRFFGYDVAVANSSAYGGFRYTAPHTGVVDLTFNELGVYCGMNVTYTAARLAIFVDGVMVFPTAGDAWYTPFDATYTKHTSVSETVNALLPRGLFVEAGSTVDVLFTRAAGSSDSIWDGAGNAVDMYVGYTQIFAPATQASASLAADLCMDFSVAATGNIFAPQSVAPYVDAASLSLSLSCPAAEVADARVEIGEPQLSGGKLHAAVTGFAAKQMTEEITYTVTGTVKLPDGSQKTDTVLRTGTVSIASYLRSLIEETADTATRDLAIATLRYGAAAQTYFSYKTASLADAGLTEELSFTPAPATDIAAQTARAGQTYAFSGASLLLEDTVVLRLLLDALDAPAADYAGYTLRAVGSSASLPLSVRMQDDSGRYLAATVEIPYGKFADALTFYVTDGAGDPVTGELTYSVFSYIARTDDDASMTDLNAALLALGRAVENYRATGSGEIVARMVVLSDAHIGEDETDATPKLVSALNQSGAYFGQAPDAILMPGDYTNHGYDSEYAEFLSIMNEHVDPTKTAVSIAIGNHEHYRNGYKTAANTEEEILSAFAAFRDWFAVGKEYESGKQNAVIFNGKATLDGVDSHIVVGGIHVISVAERDCVGHYNTAVPGYTTADAYLLAEVKAAAEADPEAPIIIHSHLGSGALKNAAQAGLHAATVAELANYPQIIWISGHTHFAGQDPYMIQQTNYTNVQLGTTGSKWWWDYSGQQRPTDAISDYAYEASQGLFITVYADDRVEMQRYDFTHMAPVGAAWVVDTAAILASRDNFTYTDARRQDAAAPVFAEGAALTVDAVTANGATVSLPVAHVYDAVSDDAVPYYYVVAIDQNGDVAYSAKELSHYYRGEAENDPLTVHLSNLTAGQTYTVMVVAESFFEKSSAPLTTEITLPN